MWGAVCREQGAGWAGQPLLPVQPVLAPPAPHPFPALTAAPPSPACPLQAFEKITGHSWDRKKIRWEWTDCSDRSEGPLAAEEPKEEPKPEEKEGE